MTPVDYFALAVLIAMLLPMAILPSERGTAPAWLALALAAAGIATNYARSGPEAALLALGTGLFWLAVLSVGLTGLRRTTQFIFLTGWQIRFLAAGTCWVGPFWAVLLVITAILLIVADAMVKSIRSGSKARPDTDLVIAISLASIMIIKITLSV